MWFTFFLKTYGFRNNEQRSVRCLNKLDILLENYMILLYTYINQRRYFMKSSRIMKIFEQYVRKYDMNNIDIKARYFHSLKVMELARELATGLGIFLRKK